MNTKSCVSEQETYQRREKPGVPIKARGAALRNLLNSGPIDAPSKGYLLESLPNNAGLVP